MSDSGVASPRASDPNNRTSTTLADRLCRSRFTNSVNPSCLFEAEGMLVVYALIPSFRVPDLREDPLVLAEHDVPPVVPPHVFAAVAAHRGPELRIAHQQLQTLDEFIAVRVVQAAVAVDRVLDQHGAARVCDDRRADRERLEREERQALI